MKYGTLDIYPQSGTLIYKESKTVVVQEYPRLNKADSYLMHLNPPQVMCTLLLRNKAQHIALKQLDRAHTEANLYIDRWGKEAHYYKQAVLELGEDRPGVGEMFLVSATFTALDPHVYETATHKVVY